MTADSIRLRAKLLQVMFERKGFVVAEMSTAHNFGEQRPKRFIFTGVKHPLELNSYMSIEGEINNHPEHGLQFKVTTYSKESSLMAALLNGEVPSVGKETGARIWALLGDEVESLNSAEPLCKLSGIGPKKAFTILASIQKYKETL